MAGIETKSRKIDIDRVSCVLLVSTTSREYTCAFSMTEGFFVHRLADDVYRIDSCNFENFSTVV